MKVIGRLFARGNGSSLKRKNAYPLLGKPMLWRFLTEIKKASFIDEIFVWTEDDELAAITESCGCHVIPRSRDQIFYFGGFSDPNQWGAYLDEYIQSKCGTLGDIRVGLNCNYCLITADILESMYERLMNDRTADSIIPVTRVDPHLYTVNPKTGCLFPVWVHPGLDRQDYPDLYRAGGISINHSKRGIHNFGLRMLFHEVQPEYLLDIHDEDDVKLAEYYLMRRMGGKITLPDTVETEKDYEDKGKNVWGAALTHQAVR